MTRRPTFALAIALLVGCAPATGTAGGGGPVSYDQKVKRIEALTQALSLGQNEELQKSLQGAQTVGATMSQGAFKQTTAAASGMVAAGGGNMVAAGGGNLVAAGGGNMVAAGGGNMVAAGGMNYALRALVEDLNRAVRHDTYKLAATASMQDGSTVTYDDATGELQAVQSADAAATFTYKVAGDTRTWTMDMTRSPDGTVGKLSVEIAASTWVDQAPPAAEPDPFTQPTDDPWAGPGPGPGPGLPGDDDDFGQGDPEATDEEEADFDDEGGFGLQQAMGEVTPRIFGGQQPDFNTVSRVRVKADFKAQGQDNLRLVVDALLDEWAPVQGTQVPARLGLAFDVASLGIKTDTRVGWASLDLASQGEFKIRTKEAQESFTYNLAMQTKAGTGKLDLTNQGARMRFGATIKPGTPGAPPETTTGLYDSDTGVKLADMVPSTSKPGVVEIRFTDGRVLQWDPASGQTMAVPGAGPTTRPSAAPSARPTTRPAASDPQPSFPKF